MNYIDKLLIVILILAVVTIFCFSIVSSLHNETNNINNDCNCSIKLNSLVNVEHFKQENTHNLHNKLAESSKLLNKHGLEEALHNMEEIKSEQINFINNDKNKKDKNKMIINNEHKIPNKGNIYNPDDLDEVDHHEILNGNNIIHQLTDEEQLLLNIKSCPNKSIQEKFKEGKNMIQPYAINCNKKPDHNNDNNEDFDPADYYRKNNKYIPCFMDDPNVRGSNYGDYTNATSIYNIGNIDLNYQPDPTNKKTKYPVGNGYVFNNTPSKYE
jgi:hypothetical protein